MTTYTIYDLVGKTKDAYWSPHTWKTIAAFNLKKLLPYKLVRLTFIQVAEEIIPKITNGKADTVPVVEIDSNGAKECICDSWDIALWLEKTFSPPKYPALFPGNAIALHRVFETTGWTSKYLRDCNKCIMLDIYKEQDPKNQEWFRKSREGFLKKSLEQVVAESPEAEKSLMENWGISVYTPLHDSKQEYLSGDVLGYADIIAYAFIQWPLILQPELGQKLINRGPDSTIPDWYKRVHVQIGDIPKHCVSFM